jgi:type I restriction enzyme S subunit
MAKTYESYKDSGIAWIGEIPSEWKVEKARHLFTQRNSRGNDTPVLLSATQLHGMYPQHLLEGVVQVHKDTDLQTFKTVHKNDYVISLRSFQGGFEMSDFEGVCSPAYQVFYNISKICHQYYKLLFKSQGFISMINSLVVGIREGKNIQYGSFSYSYLPVPPINEQEKIASFLDTKCGEIDSLISLQEEMISELQAYKQSVITEAVTKGLDPNAKMNCCASREKNDACISSSETQPAIERKFKDSGVEWIGEIPEGWKTNRLKYLCSIATGNKDTQDSEEDGIYKFYVRSPIIEHSNSWTFEGEGILMAGDGAGAGRVFHHAFGKYAVHQRVYRMADFKSINTNFLYYYLSSLFCRIMDMGSAQSTVPSVRLPMLTNFVVCIPPLSEQQAIASYLDAKTSQIDSLITLKQQKIDELKDYKKSIIYEYVTGKKRV